MGVRAVIEHFAHSKKIGRPGWRQRLAVASGFWLRRRVLVCAQRPVRRCRLEPADAEGGAAAAARRVI